MTKIYKFILIVSATIVINSCGGGGGGISVLPTTDAYDETESVNVKIDILWVVDPSRSMRQNVKRVSDNIETFVSDFVTKGYDFKMGVISTAAWAKLAYDENNSLPVELSSVLAKLHQGECVGLDSAFPELTSGSVAPNDVYGFVTKFRQNFDVYGLELNTSGCGLNHLTGYAPVTGNVFASLAPEERSEIAKYVNDERPLQSMETYLTENGVSFLRPDAFLAVIIISDEMDASRSNLEPTSAYSPSDATNYNANHFTSYLAGLKGGDTNKFGVYSIVNNSLAGAENNISKLVADQSGGLSFDIAANSKEYSDHLGQIKGEILSSSSIYFFKKEPLVQSIVVEIVKTGGAVISVPEALSGGEGWTFNGTYGSFGGLEFSGTYIPDQGDEVIVKYTPANLNPGEINEPYLNLSDNEVLEEEPVGTTVGTVSIVNMNLGPNDETSFSITSSPTSFSIDDTGLVQTTAVLNAEDFVSEKIDIELVVTHKDEEGTTTGTTPLSRSITIKILDIADNIPEANSVGIVVSASDYELDTITISGTLSNYVSKMDVLETHNFTVDDSSLDASDESLVITNAETGAFTYSIPKSSLPAGSTHTRSIPYTVTGSEHIPDPLANNSDSSTLTITITEENTAPEYSVSVCPGGNYEYCDEIAEEHVVRPNTEGVTFGAVPLTGSDITVSGTAAGNKDALVIGSANFQSAANGQGYHEVTITFPENKMYEVGCIQITRDGNSSLGNAIYQILTPDTLQPVTREVFPVSLQGNSNIPKPSNLPPGQCNPSSSHFTIYTTGKFIGGGLRVLRPSGSVNDQGHKNLRLDRIQVFGIEAKFNEIPLDDHFSDADGDALTYIITDAFGEGPGPGWAHIDSVTKTLRLLPTASVNESIGIIAMDGPSGDPATKEAFASIKVVGSGGASAENAAPVSLLSLDDSRRGGLSMRRWGGDSEAPPADCTIPSGKNNLIDHIEMDNFMAKPFGGLNDYYDILTDPEQSVHNGDIYSSEQENGWCNTPVYEDNKYPLKAIDDNYCSDTDFNTTSNRGKIIPCVNDSRKYGEVYSGFFVPASTGVYKFRTNSIDNTITLSLAPTEYHEDVQKLFTAVNNDGSLFNVLESLVPGFTDSASAGNEFENCSGCRSVPYDTNLFFDLNDITTDYSDGYAYLKQGNVYAFEMRFGEGGSAVAFDFFYSRKDVGGSSWSDWSPLDASVVVPDRGPSAHTSFEVPVSGGSVNFDTSSLFYDAEMDVLEYTARLVEADGSDFGDGSIGQIGLSLNLLTGVLEGNISYSGDPRIVIKAKERRSDGKETESLPIKFRE